MNSSGIKKGLAATAIAALAVTGIPALAGTAHAAIGSVVVTSLSAYDFDEFGDATPDIVVTIKETNNTPTVGQAVEYSYVFTPEGGVAQAATAYAPGGITGADGTVDLLFDPVLAGSYTVTVRTVGSHISATAPVTFVAGDAEITWADGVSARSPQNGSDTYAGKLVLDNAAATPLSGRVVDVHYDSAGNAVMSTPQPAGTLRVNDDDADATTGADGSFSVGLTDPAAPVGTDSGTLEATTGFTAQSDLGVTFEPTPVVTHIDVTDANVFADVAPGKPVELNVVVRGQLVADDTPENDPIIKDYPVSFAVDKGFLTPDTQGHDLNVDPTDLDLTDEQDDKDDLFGFYEDLGPDETVDTSDTPGTNAAGIVATIGKDAGFNDDGLVTQTVTVTAGGKSDTVEIDYDVRNYLNLTAAAFRKDGGSTRVPGAVDLKLYAVDQFGNLVGDHFAILSDDTPIARVAGEFGSAQTTTDFLNDNPAARASSSNPVVQTITARIPADENLVDAAGNPAPTTDKNVFGKQVLRWTKSKTAIVAKLTGRNNGGKADRLTVVTSKKANGATVKLFKIVNGKRKAAGTKTLKNGRVTFVKADKNGNGFTKYIAKVKPTGDTQGARTNKRNVR